MSTSSSSLVAEGRRRPIPKDQITPIQVAIDCCLFLALFVTPWIISTQLKEVFNTTKNIWVGLVATVLALAWLTDCVLKREVRVPKGKVVIFYGLLIGWSFLTISWSIFWRLSFLEYSYQFAMFLLFLVTYCNVYDRERIENLLHFSIAAGVVSAGYALIQYYGFDVPIFTRLTSLFSVLPDPLGSMLDFRFLILPPKPDEATKIYSFMGHRNYLAGYLIAVLPITLSRLYAAISNVAEQKSMFVDWLAALRAGQGGGPGLLALVRVLRAPLVYTFSITLMFVTVLLTHTRGSWVGLSIALAIFFGMLYLKFPIYAGWRRTSMVLGLFLGLLFLVGPRTFGIFGYEVRNPFNREPRSILQRVADSRKVHSQASAHQRLLIYRTAIFMILDNPTNFLFGTGFGTFGLQYMPYQKLVLREDPPHSAIQKVVDRAFEVVFFEGQRGSDHWIVEINKSIYAHNEILHFWAEIGLVGIVLMLTLLYYFFRDVLRYLVRAKADDEALLFLGMVSSVCAVLGHNLFTFDLHLAYTSALFWFLIAACQRYLHREDWVFSWAQKSEDDVTLAGAPFRLGLEQTPDGAINAWAEQLVPEDVANAPAGPVEWRLVVRDPEGQEFERKSTKAGQVSFRRPFDAGEWRIRLTGPEGASHDLEAQFSAPNPATRPIVCGILLLGAFMVIRAVFSQAMLENAWRDAFLKFRNHQFEDSFIDYRKAIRQDSHRGEILFDFGRALMDSNRNKAAIRAFERATASFVDPANYHNVALCYYKEGDLAAAEKAYRTALDLNIIYEQSLSNLAYLLMDKAGKAAAEGNKEEAAKLNKESEGLLERGLRFYRNNSQFSSTLGAMRAQQGNSAEAARLFEMALKSDPGQCKVWINYGTVLYNLKRYDKALDAMKQARKHCKGAEDDLVTGKFISVLKGYYHEVLTKNPTDRTAITSYGKDLIEAGLYTEAQDVFRKLLESVAPGDPEATFQMAICYWKLGYRDQARQQLNRLKAAVPADGKLGKAIASQLDLLEAESAQSTVPVSAGMPLTLPGLPSR